jgi:hypothetical protein
MIAPGIEINLEGTTVIMTSALLNLPVKTDVWPGHVLIFLFAPILSELVQVRLQTSTFLSKHKIVGNKNFAPERIFTLGRKTCRSCVSGKRQYLPVKMKNLPDNPRLPALISRPGAYH